MKVDMNDEGGPERTKLFWPLYETLLQNFPLWTKETEMDLSESLQWEDGA